MIVYTTAGSDPYYQATAWDVSKLLSRFSINDWSDTCLAHLFTHQGSRVVIYMRMCFV